MAKTYLVGKKSKPEHTINNHSKNAESETGASLYSKIPDYFPDLNFQKFQNEKIFRSLIFETGRSQMEIRILFFRINQMQIRIRINFLISPKPYTKPYPSFLKPPNPNPIPKLTFFTSSIPNTIASIPCSLSFRIKEHYRFTCLIVYWV